MKIILTILLLSLTTTLFCQTRVRGYVRSNGTYVEPHYRSSPNSTKYDNYSTKGNINPYTGKVGTKNVYDNNYNTYGVDKTVPTSNYIVFESNSYNSYYYERLNYYERRKRRGAWIFIASLIATTAIISLTYKP